MTQNLTGIYLVPAVGLLIVHDEIQPIPLAIPTLTNITHSSTRYSVVLKPGFTIPWGHALQIDHDRAVLERGGDQKLPHFTDQLLIAQLPPITHRYMRAGCVSQCMSMPAEYLST